MAEKRKLLVADDEEMIREAVASYLESQGYQVFPGGKWRGGTEHFEERTDFSGNFRPDASGSAGRRSLCPDSETVARADHHADCQKYGI